MHPLIFFSLIRDPILFLVVCSLRFALSFHFALVLKLAFLVFFLFALRKFFAATFCLFMLAHNTRTKNANNSQTLCFCSDDAPVFYGGPRISYDFGIERLFGFI